jgi:hypothetical protein
MHMSGEGNVLKRAVKDRTENTSDRFVEEYKYRENHTHNNKETYLQQSILPENYTAQENHTENKPEASWMRVHEKLQDIQTSLDHP